MSPVFVNGPAARGRPVVGVIGGGQLCRMLQHAAIRLDVELRVFGDDTDEAAPAVVPDHTTGRLDDVERLDRFARQCDVITLDHENVPTETVRALEQRGHALAPSAATLLLAADKATQRRHLSALGFPVPDFAVATSREEVAGRAAELGWPAVVKAARGGYDGRGVAVLRSHPTPTEWPAFVGRVASVVEPLLPLRGELAVVVARRADGDRAVYPAVGTVQVDGMCHAVVAPAPVPPRLRRRAEALAAEVADAVGAVGILAVELFLVGDELLVNELAPRPHNSGHLTLDACRTSQFENHLRAVLGWPLGDTALTTPAAAMVNVVGRRSGPPPTAGAALRDPGVHCHLYGKSSRPGRKLGHVTVCDTTTAEALRRAEQAAARIDEAHADTVADLERWRRGAA